MAGVSAEKPGMSLGARFPVGLFSSSMGLGGLGLVWRDAHSALGVSQTIGEALLALTGVLFIVLTGALVVKVTAMGRAFLEEAQSPAVMNQLAAPSISLVLLSSGLTPYAPELAELLWIFASGLNLLISVYVMMWCWLPRGQVPASVTPAYFVPLVANIVIPIAGEPFGYDGFNWMVFGLSVFFFLTLTPIILYRLIVEAPMPKPQEPLMFIFLAPPSLCFSAYVVLNDGWIDASAEAMFGTVAFFAVAILIRGWRFVLTPYSLPFWATTFPLAAMAKAFVLMHEHHQTSLSALGAWVALTLATVMITLVFCHAGAGLYRRALY